jgi:hypothetical protein
MTDVEIRKMSGELRSEGGVVIRLNSLDSEGRMVPDLLKDFYSSLRIVMIVHAQHAETRGFVDGSELIEALAHSAHPGNELHIELHRAARNREGSVGRLGTWAIFLQRDSANVMPMKDL